eukprot:scaffold9059_cov66-Skeletonema_menzelii.AAC.1
MQTQIPSGAYDGDEAFRATELNSNSDNDGLLPEDFINSDADDIVAAEVNDGADAGANAEAAVAPRCGYWSSKNFKLLACFTLLSALICIFAASGSSIKAYHTRRSDAADLQAAYGNYGPATPAPSKAAKSKCPKSSSKASKYSYSNSMKSKSPKASSSKSPKASNDSLPETTCAPTQKKKGKTKAGKNRPTNSPRMVFGRPSRKHKRKLTTSIVR